MKRITAVFIFLLSLWLLGAVPPAAAAGEDGDPAQFAAAADQMEFILPLRTAAAGVNPRFLSEQRQLLLPLAGLDLARPAAFSRRLDDDWIAGYGLKKVDGGFAWYFTKRETGLPLKKLLAVRVADRRLVITILKPYRPLPTAAGEAVLPAAGGAKPAAGLAANAGKLAKINAILAGVKEKETAAPPRAPGGDRSLLAAGIKVFAILLALVAIILLAYGPVKKLVRGTVGPVDGSLVRVLRTVPIGVKQQVMFLEVAGEVLVVGICGEQMSLLTRIVDPEKVATLRALPAAAPGKKTFAGVLRAALGRPVKRGGDPDAGDPAAGGRDAGGMTATAARAVAGGADSPDGLDSYRQVLAQIRQRLDGMTQL
ncbi:MAG: flagellar biosynthetic protein FliO [Deltaproteobacteria bacterium]|nr:flagellar biosynthetic protein FliO [Deltaproteobacteria bacterium]